MTLKTTLTPAEHANVSQGTSYFENLHAFIDDTGEASDIIGMKVIRRNMAITEIVVRIGACGSASATQIDVKKNGTSVLAAVITSDNADADGSVYVAVPDTDAHASLVPGDVVTIETGTVATNVEDICVEVRIANRYSEPAA